jgi:hypothetical protein
MRLDFIFYHLDELLSEASGGDSGIVASRAKTEEFCDFRGVYTEKLVDEGDKFGGKCIDKEGGPSTEEDFGEGGWERTDARGDGGIVGRQGKGDVEKELNDYSGFDDYVVRLPVNRSEFQGGDKAALKSRISIPLAPVTDIFLPGLSP